MKGVLFDFNGTRFFDSPLHCRAWKRIALEYFHKQLTDEDLDKNVQGRPNNLILSYLSPSTLSEEKRNEIANEKEVRYRKLASSDPAFLHFAPGLTLFLEFLKKNHVPRAIATSSEKSNRAWYRKVFPLLEYFPKEAIVYDDGSFQRGKPDPQIYEVAAKRIHLDPSSCVIFEDSASGLLSAYRAKAGKIVLVKDKNCPPTFLIPSYVDETIENYTPRKENILRFLGL